MQRTDVDPQETREWLEALDAVVEHDGADRAKHLLERVVGHAPVSGAAPAPAGTTPHLQTIPPPRDHPAPEPAPAAARAGLPGRLRPRAPRALDHALERDLDRAPVQQGVLR